MMGQHLAYAATQTERIKPFPGQVRAWAIYRLLESSDHKLIFIGVTSNQHWQRFCEVFDRPDLYSNEALSNNSLRYEAADWLLPELEGMFKTMSFKEILSECESGNFPYAPLNAPEDLWDNPHLAAGTWLDVPYSDANITAKLPRQPLLFNHQGHTLYQPPPKVGEHTQMILAELGYDEKAIADLRERQIIG